ncbi:alpha/beta hydrolase [Ornithinimicrobium cerasi]|uniref:Predicted hydrolase of the alpha/beta superfamily n=1 Tax=Ornithinimicrobium cerasi TaxID=2248773 RepID=A0A285VNE4_9MICO|nr:alpha/beta hydrolase-fold protein [Ornithinimicrobium cerasi]SOC55108.1 Predicted hydrolase of the alpha/beta superfamily [Ornithinimicrobium cerasi]
MILTPGGLRPIRHPQLQGDLRSWTDVELPGLGRRAEVYAWLPPGYDEGDERYPVLYLHDGHNVFLDERANGGVSWDVDRAMTRLAQDGLAAIVVAVPCHPTLRHEEYTQHPHPLSGGGRAADYARFLCEELKPAVDATLRTRPEPRHTLTAGSSLGGVVSAYLWASRQDVFGGAGVFSPAFWWPGDRALDEVAAQLAVGGLEGRVHVDVGGLEQPGDPVINGLYVEQAERLVGILRDGGIPVHYVFDSAAAHFEDAWARRFPGAVRWLLDGYAADPPPHVVAAEEQDEPR